MRATVVLYDCADAPRVVHLGGVGLRAAGRAIELARRVARADYVQLPADLDELAAAINSGREAETTGEERAKIDGSVEVPDSVFVSQAIAARRLGCDPRTVRSYLDRGVLPCTRPLGGNRKIRSVDLDRFIEQGGHR